MMHVFNCFDFATRMWQPFFNENKKENLPIKRPGLQLYGKVLEKPNAEEWHGNHSKKFR